MYVEEIITLVRLSQAGENTVADLAQTVLDLVEQLRDSRVRADLAEANLAHELRRTDDVRQRIAAFRGDDPASLTRLLLDLAEVIRRG